MISIVTTLYYSEHHISEFYHRCLLAVKNIGADYEIVFVNDGSPDDSKRKVLGLREKDKNVRLIDLSRNFGHHAAIITGLAAAKGETIFLIDSDLEEDPFHLVALQKEMSENLGCELVYGVQPARKGRWFERLSGNLYYKMFDQLSEVSYPSDTLTARLMTKKFRDAVLQYPEREVDVWCLFSLVGFHQRSIPLSKTSKATTTYTLARKLRMAVNSITSVSSKPLYFIFLLGLLITGFSVLMIFYIIVNRIMYNDIVEGWTSTILSVWLIGGLIIFSLGVIGIYLAKLFNEVKARPRSIINEEYGASGEE